jgi:hypothetical protein
VTAKIPITKNEKGQPPLEQAEAELFPSIPYESYTQEMRFASYERAKQIIFERTGYLIPAVGAL